MAAFHALPAACVTEVARCGVVARALDREDVEAMRATCRGWAAALAAFDWRFEHLTALVERVVADAHRQAPRLFNLARPWRAPPDGWIVSTTDDGEAGVRIGRRQLLGAVAIMQRMTGHITHESTSLVTLTHHLNAEIAYRRELRGLFRQPRAAADQLTIIAYGLSVRRARRGRSSVELDTSSSEVRVNRCRIYNFFCRNHEHHFSLDADERRRRFGVFPPAIQLIDFL